MFDAVFEGHFATVTDTHPASDPWGMGITVDVLRADHQDCKDWDDAHPVANAGVWDQVAAIAAKAAVRAQLTASARPGFRQAPKKTKAEQEASASEEGDDTESLIAQAIRDIPDETIGEMLKKVGSADLNDAKPRLARVVMKGWGGVRDVGGEPIPFDLHSALRFLGWEGFLVEKAGEDPEFLAGDRDDEDAHLLASEGVGATVTAFTGNPRKADGSLWTCPAGMKYGPAPVGDAITKWLVDASAEGTIARAAAVEKAADFLAATPPGTPDTSTVQ